MQNQPKTLTGGQAYPRSYAYQLPEAGKSELRSEVGLTKREVYAKDAMKGLLASECPESIFQTVYGSNEEVLTTRYQVVAKEAVAHADALLLELEH